MGHFSCHDHAGRVNLRHFLQWCSLTVGLLKCDDHVLHVLRKPGPLPHRATAHEPPALPATAASASTRSPRASSSPPRRSSTTPSSRRPTARCSPPRRNLPSEIPRCSETITDNRDLWYNLYLTFITDNRRSSCKLAGPFSMARARLSDARAQALSRAFPLSDSALSHPLIHQKLALHLRCAKLALR